MTIVPSSSDKQEETPSPDSPLRHDWPIILIVFLLAAGSGYASFILSLLSIDKVVIQIFLWVNFVCFVATILMLIKRRYGLACLSAVSPVPIAFGVSILYLNAFHP